MAEIATRHLMSIDIDAAPPMELGETPQGRRRIVPVTGGRFTGARLSGRIVQPSGDWALVRRDGTFIPDVRILLQTDDGALISFSYGGRWHADAATMQRLMRREGDLDVTGIYWRTDCAFECASDGPYAWLNNVIAIGTGRPKIGGVLYEVHEVL
jgi:hypothetical protein